MLWRISLYLIVIYISWARRQHGILRRTHWGPARMGPDRPEKYLTLGPKCRGTRSKMEDFHFRCMFIKYFWLQDGRKSEVDGWLQTEVGGSQERWWWEGAKWWIRFQVKAAGLSAPKLIAPAWAGLMVVPFTCLRTLEKGQMLPDVFCCRFALFLGTKEICLLRARGCKQYKNQKRIWL